jgi:hypothetical protein
VAHWQILVNHLPTVTVVLMAGAWAVRRSSEAVLRLVAGFVAIFGRDQRSRPDRAFDVLKATGKRRMKHKSSSRLSLLRTVLTQSSLAIGKPSAVTSRTDLGFLRFDGHSPSGALPGRKERPWSGSSHGAASRSRRSSRRGSWSGAGQVTARSGRSLATLTDAPAVRAWVNQAATEASERPSLERRSRTRLRRRPGT